MTEAEAEVLVFQPGETRNTGNIVDEKFKAPNGVASDDSKPDWVGWRPRLPRESDISDAVRVYSPFR
jgi:hypothetical protein